MDALHAALKSGFGFSSFRPGQEAAIRAVLEGKDALIVMPTGSGKSLCFQLPAMLSEGTMIVVSPLIALMKDQVDALSARKIPATFLNSTLTPSESAFRLNAMRSGRYRLVYVAPERFRNPRFLEALHETPLTMLAIDEAHCISTWGHDFRPDYLHLERIVATLSPEIRIIAVTATATDSVRKDILHHLGLGKNGRTAPEIFVNGFARPNLRLTVSRTVSHDEKLERVLKILETFRTGIIYCATRRAVEKVQALLKPHGYRVMIYHGAMNDEERTRVQDAFMRGTLPIVVATNAFGMGVDRPDIRFVIHWDIPGSVEAYYQEVGRAGRDGAYAWCELLFSPADIHTQEFFITTANPPEELVYECYSAIRNACRQSTDGAAMFSPEEWAGRAGLPSPLMVRNLMAHFERAGLLTRHRKNGEPYSSIRVPATVDADALTTICHALKQKAVTDHAQLRRMIDFVGTPHCRHRFLLDYFGDTTSSESACSHCDRCAPRTTFPPRLPLSEARRTDLRKILSCIVRMQGRGDFTLAAEILRGTAPDSWQKLSTFGLLRAASQEAILANCEALEMEGCLSGMTVTPFGYDLIKERVLPEHFLQLPETAFSAAQTAAAAPLPLQGLAAALREWVREEATRYALPPFCILNSKLIAELARKRPTTEEELRLIPGIGERRIAKHGEALLALIRAYE